MGFNILVNNKFSKNHFFYLTIFVFLYIENWKLLGFFLPIFLYHKIEFFFGLKVSFVILSR
jgi:hypothetical protein